MPDLSVPPDIADLDIPIDAWTRPFWDGTARHALMMPCCGECARYRWPPGPFCPHCRSQALRWMPAGEAQVYSFTVVRSAQADAAGRHPVHIPALIAFPGAGGVRLLAAIINTDPEQLRIGDRLRVVWTTTGSETVPAFVPVERPCG